AARSAVAQAGAVVDVVAPGDVVVVVIVPSIVVVVLVPSIVVVVLMPSIVVVVVVDCASTSAASAPVRKTSFRAPPSPGTTNRTPGSGLPWSSSRSIPSSVKVCE